MSFTSDLEAWAEKSGATMHEVVVEFVLDLSAKVVVGDGMPGNGTPVDTGWARNNWVASIGSPNLSILDGYDKTGSKTMSKIALTSLSATGNLFYLTNNVEYINILEYGSSNRPPNGMVRLGIMAAKSELSRKINGL